MEIKGKRILITGGSGFIGSRLCEVLYLHYEPSKLTVLVRNMGRAARIGRMRIRIIKGNILNPEQVEALVSDSDIIIHLAAGDRKTIVKGTKIVARLARKYEVARFIHMSSAAVYGLRPDPTHNREEAPLRYTGNPYSDAKIDAEKIVKKEIRKGLKAVILRPRIIYGPYSVYVTTPFTNVSENKFPLIDDGLGACNCVYIDNLIWAIILSIKQDKAVGNTFFVTDGEKKTWGDFYRAILEPLGDVKFFNIESSQSSDLLSSTHKSYIKTLKTFFTSSIMKDFLKEAPLLSSIVRPVFSYLYDLPEERKIRIKDAIGIDIPERRIRDRGELPTNFDASRLIRESGSGYTDISKAKSILGYTPIVTFEEGIKLTKEWLRFAKII